MEPSSRRDFLKTAAVTTAALGVAHIPSTARSATAGESIPWYRRTLRWGQTNITEADPQRYDIDWWRKQWKRTHTQGIIVNAGGIVAYYPSKVPFHRPAQNLGNRDLFGELCRAAHEDGLVVLARMDSSRAHEELYRAHPDWFCLDDASRPHTAGEMFVTCVNGPYYEQQIPAILRELTERYHPDGFTDNSWSGLGRNSFCHCENCRKKFRQLTGNEIPRSKDWNSPVYRQWIRWNYQRRLEIWDLNNQITTSAGGPDCIWSGMNSGTIAGQCQSFRDYKAICERACIIMLDHQSRSDAAGFQHNGETGKLIHGLLGWNKLIPESMAMYQAGKPTFRLASKPTAEARMWMLDGIAGGLQPWWHHVGAYHEDRRMYRTAAPVYSWHQKNSEILINREPVATVGVVWSQQNTDFHGRDDPELLVELPWRGIIQALVRARIPYLPIHADHIDRDGGKFSALILPNFAAMSDAQLASIRRFVARGGGILATGQTSLFDEFGDPRTDYGLADLFCAHLDQSKSILDESWRRKQATDTAHTYLRLTPERRTIIDRPRSANEPSVGSERHQVLHGFEETDLIPFGGLLEGLKVDSGAEALLTFVPPFPIYPPETSWMRQPKTDIPGLIMNATPGGARIAFLAADLDRRFARDHLPDHGDLLANLARWVAKDNIPISVIGSGLVDCHLYQQHSRAILHVVNLTSTGTWRQPIHELIPIGPLKIQLKLTNKFRAAPAHLMVANETTHINSIHDSIQFQLKSILDHEVVVIETA